MNHNKIQATGFEHWFLGTAEIAEPLVMPTHLPYAFSQPDINGRVPFPDIVLASGYSWAMDAQNGYPLHTSDANGVVLTDEQAVARCMLRPYMHAVYGAQRFVEQSGSDPDEGSIDAEQWRQSIGRFLLRESGINPLQHCCAYLACCLLPPGQKDCLQ